MITRAAAPGDLCACGRQAIEVFVGDEGDEVGYCGIADGGGHIDPCPFCYGTVTHIQHKPCPLYRLHPHPPT